MPLYEKGSVRIHYEEAGSGFPLLIIPGGGLNSTIANLSTSSPISGVVSSALFGPRSNRQPSRATVPITPPGRVPASIMPTSPTIWCIWAAISSA